MPIVSMAALAVAGLAAGLVGAVHYATHRATGSPALFGAAGVSSAGTAVTGATFFGVLLLFELSALDPTTLVPSGDALLLGLLGVTVTGVAVWAVNDMEADDG
jgi:drug/metabolite transporter (DMT)-like permease